MQTTLDPESRLGDFLRCCKATADPAAYDALARRHGPDVLKARMDSLSGATGGFLVPQRLAEELYQTVEEESIVRPRATVVEMTSETLDLPLPDASIAQSAGTPPYFGGFSLSWTQEGATRTQSEPAWASAHLKAWELSGVCYASNTMLADASPGTEAFLRRLFARSVAWAEDVAFLIGDGVGKPIGMRHAGCAKARTRQTATDFTFADAAAMVAMLLPSSWTRAFWLVHPLALAKVVALATSTTAVVQANQGRIAGGGPFGWLHNLPVYVSDKLPALGTAGDVMLIDPLLYVIGDRLTIEVALSRDEPAAFTRNQSVFRILARRAGRPWLRQAVTLADGANTVSPFVYLS